MDISSREITLHLASLDIHDLLKLREELNWRIKNKEDEKRVGIWSVTNDDWSLGFFSTYEKAVARLVEHAKEKKDEKIYGYVIIKEIRVPPSDLPTYYVDEAADA